MNIQIRNTQKKVKIKELFSSIGIPDEEHASKTPPVDIRVKTPAGYKRIANMFRTEKQNTVTTYFGNNKTLKTSPKHRVKSNGEWVFTKDLSTDQLVETESGHTKVVEQKSGKSEILFDISVEDVHCYYSNGILSHNSWCLNKVGAEALRQGKNVVHFTMELQQKYVGRRYDCCFTGIDFQSIVKNKNKVVESLESLDGFLKIKYYPIKTVSALSLRSYIDRIQMLTNKKVDLVIVDYADILRPISAEKNSNSYQESGGIYEELRAMAGELQIPVWTASQANRSQTNEEIIEAGGIADSYRKIMTADFVASISRKREDKLQNTARMHIIKNRFGADGLTFPCMFDASCGQIDIFDPSSESGKNVYKKMGDGENAVKDRVRRLWDKTEDSTDTEDLG